MMIAEEEEHKGDEPSTMTSFRLEDCVTMDDVAIFLTRHREVCHELLNKHRPSLTCLMNLGKAGAIQIYDPSSQSLFFNGHEDAEAHYNNENQFQLATPKESDRTDDISKWKNVSSLVKSSPYTDTDFVFSPLVKSDRPHPNDGSGAQIQGNDKVKRSLNYDSDGESKDDTFHPASEVLENSHSSAKWEDFHETIDAIPQSSPVQSHHILESSSATFQSPMSFEETIDKIPIEPPKLDAPIFNTMESHSVNLEEPSDDASDATPRASNNSFSGLDPSIESSMQEFSTLDMPDDSLVHDLHREAQKYSNDDVNIDIEAQPDDVGESANDEADAEEEHANTVEENKAVVQLQVEKGDYDGSDTLQDETNNVNDDNMIDISELEAQEAADKTSEICSNQGGYDDAEIINQSPAQPHEVTKPSSAAIDFGTLDDVVGGEQNTSPDSPELEAAVMPDKGISDMDGTQSISILAKNDGTDKFSQGAQQGTGHHDADDAASFSETFPQPDSATNESSASIDFGTPDPVTSSGEKTTEGTLELEAAAMLDKGTSEVGTDGVNTVDVSDDANKINLEAQQGADGSYHDGDGIAKFTEAQFQSGAPTNESSPSIEVGTSDNKRTEETSTAMDILGPESPVMSCEDTSDMGTRGVIPPSLKAQEVNIDQGGDDGGGDEDDKFFEATPQPDEATNETPFSMEFGSPEDAMIEKEYITLLDDLKSDDSVNGKNEGRASAATMEYCTTDVALDKSNRDPGDMVEIEEQVEDEGLSKADDDDMAKSYKTEQLGEGQLQESVELSNIQTVASRDVVAVSAEPENARKTEKSKDNLDGEKVESFANPDNDEAYDSWLRSQTSDAIEDAIAQNKDADVNATSQQGKTPDFVVNNDSTGQPKDGEGESKEVDSDVSHLSTQQRGSHGDWVAPQQYKPVPGLAADLDSNETAQVAENDENNLRGNVTDRIKNVKGDIIEKMHQAEQVDIEDEKSVDGFVDVMQSDCLPDSRGNGTLMYLNQHDDESQASDLRSDHQLDEIQDPSMGSSDDFDVWLPGHPDRRADQDDAQIHDAETVNKDADLGERQMNEVNAASSESEARSEDDLDIWIHASNECENSAMQESNKEESGMNLPDSQIAGSHAIVKSRSTSSGHSSDEAIAARSIPSSLLDVRNDETELKQEQGEESNVETQQQNYPNEYSPLSVTNKQPSQPDKEGNPHESSSALVDVTDSVQEYDEEHRVESRQQAGRSKGSILSATKQEDAQLNADDTTPTIIEEIVHGAPGDSDAKSTDGYDIWIGTEKAVDHVGMATSPSLKNSDEPPTHQPLQSTESIGDTSGNLDVWLCGEVGDHAEQGTGVSVMESNEIEHLPSREDQADRATPRKDKLGGISTIRSSAEKGQSRYPDTTEQGAVDISGSNQHEVTSVSQVEGSNLTEEPARSETFHSTNVVVVSKESTLPSDQPILSKQQTNITTASHGEGTTTETELSEQKVVKAEISDTSTTPERTTQQQEHTTVIDSTSLSEPETPKNANRQLSTPMGTDAVSGSSAKMVDKLDDLASLWQSVSKEEKPDRAPIAHDSPVSSLSPSPLRSTELIDFDLGTHEALAIATLPKLTSEKSSGKPTSPASTKRSSPPSAKVYADLAPRLLTGERAAKSQAKQSVSTPHQISSTRRPPTPKRTQVFPTKLPTFETEKRAAKQLYPSGSKSPNRVISSRIESRSNQASPTPSTPSTPRLQTEARASKSPHSSGASSPSLIMSSRMRSPADKKASSQIILKAPSFETDKRAAKNSYPTGAVTPSRILSSRIARSSAVRPISTRSAPSQQLEAGLAGSVRRASPRHTEKSEKLVCGNTYDQKLHGTMGPCDRCWSLASPAEQARFKDRGSLICIQKTKGGCDGCKVFVAPSAEEPPVRLCRKCFNDTHTKGNSRLQVYHGNYRPVMSKS